MNATAKAIIDKFGGQTALARSLGKPSTTVHEWASKGIPAKWQKVLLTKAREEKIDLTAEDFFADKSENPEKIITRIPKTTHSGELKIGNIVLPAYVLEDGQSVFSLTSIAKNLFDIKGGVVEEKLRIKALKPFLPNDLIVEENGSIPALIKFDTGGQGVGKYAQGLPVEKFIDLCDAYSALGDTEHATENQKHIAIRANQFIRACAKVGIIALVHEATGYQYEREETALQIKLSAFLADKMREWDKTFPDDLWIHFAKLTKWKGDPTKQRPQWWGKLVNELVYGYMDKDVLDWLKANAPKPIHGQNYHQWLSSQYGLDKLISHINQVIGVAKTCDSMEELRRVMAHRFGGKHFQLSFWMRT